MTHPNTNTELERQARELLAAEYERAEYKLEAARIQANNLNDDARIALHAIIAALTQAPTLPKLNIMCEMRSDDVTGCTSLNVVRVNAEDDGSFTAVTDYWPSNQAKSKAVKVTNADVSFTVEEVNECFDVLLYKGPRLIPEEIIEQMRGYLLATLQTDAGGEGNHA